MPLILPGNVGSATADAGYDVANSCRFDEPRSTNLTRTPASAGNRRTWTYSAWHKVNAYHNDLAGRFLVAQTDGSNLVDFAYGNDGVFYLGIYEGGSWKELVTNAVHRDVSAWYHVVIACDTTQSTESNRLKLYVNGVQKTSFSTEVYVSQNYDTGVNNDVSHIIGRYLGNAIYYNGYMAEVCLIDGQALTPTSFGEFDSASPTIWKPIDVSELTFGTNGFYLDFEDSADLGADVSGNSNDFTENNIAATDQATDTPTNNFCTLNPLYNWYYNPPMSEGNCKIVADSTSWGGAKGTMAVSKGKWYWEIKLSGTIANHQHGVQEINLTESVISPHNLTGSTIFYNGDGGEIKTDGAATTNDYGTLDTGDIMGIALDMDAGSYGQFTIYDQNAAIASDINLSSSSDYVMPFLTIVSSTAEVNFGGCSAFTVSSSANDENGYGNFEFEPPSGYLALCTKNLATDG